MAPHNRRFSKVSDDNSDDSSASSQQVVPSSRKRGKRNAMNKESDEYRKRRERNNLAVKKSRTKSKQKTLETLQRVSQLRTENEMLESKIKLLTKELSFLKDLFLAHAGSAHGQNMSDFDLSMLSEEGAIIPSMSPTSPGSPKNSTTQHQQDGYGRARLGSYGKDHEYAVKVEDDQS